MGHSQCKINQADLKNALIEKIITGLSLSEGALLTIFRKMLILVNRMDILCNKR